MHRLVSLSCLLGFLAREAAEEMSSISLLYLHGCALLPVLTIKHSGSAPAHVRLMTDVASTACANQAPRTKEHAVCSSPRLQRGYDAYTQYVAAPLRPKAVLVVFFSRLGNVVGN